MKQFKTQAHHINDWEDSEKVEYFGSEQEDEKVMMSLKRDTAFFSQIVGRQERFTVTTLPERWIDTRDLLSSSSLLWGSVP